MNNVGQIERVTQERVIALFQEELGYTYLGNWKDRENNSNIEEDLLATYLKKKGYNDAQITKAIFELNRTATSFSDSLYTTNKNVYQLLRYGADVRTEVGKRMEKVHFIDWENWEDNDFAIAEEVSIKGNKNKRPDIVIYVNGIALGVLELKRSTVHIDEAVRQNIANQQDHFIQPFFATVQYLFAGNDTQGLRYGTIGTPEKYYLQWKEDVEDTSRNLLDKYLLKMCDKERFLELIYDFVIFDGDKKLPRVHQYFGVKEAQKFVKRKESGIIWHTQGSGKSIVMVLLAKWILENNPNARVLVLTDRYELDTQIERVFTESDEEIYRTKSGVDLMQRLNQPKPRLLCSLIHKFGKRDTGNFNKFIQELESQESPAVGELFVFVDECHRTQSGRLHRTMKAMLPEAVFIGFTGTPLLKDDKPTSLEVFGRYIHTYKFNEGVEDGVILDLVYEARDIDQSLTSERKIDEWFKAKTKGLNDYQKSELKMRWGTMQKVLSSRSRMNKIVADIILDFTTKRRLTSNNGNAILVASSIYEACRYYELFTQTNSELKNKVAIVTSYNPNASDIATEDTGAGTDTEKEFMYHLYKDLLGSKTTEQYEDWAKAKFRNHPSQMKLLIVVSKLLTGFDAPSCTYLYIDKSMQDHGLFQAICRVNRLDTPDKDFGYIIDYMDLFKKVEDAVAVYTSELDYDEFDEKDIDILLKDRLTVGKERLDNALEALHILCEAVEPPRGTKEFIHYFCGNTEIPANLKATEPQRTTLYKKTVSLIRAYANIADEMLEAGYTENEVSNIKKEVEGYKRLRDDIKTASGETLDLKSYEADMRHLIDTYIQADESVVISPFEDMPLLDIIVNSGIGSAINSMSEGVKSDRGAIAETIENNIRKKIIQEHLTDPAFYDNMSKLLDTIIKERKTKALEYEEYLKKIAELAKNVNEGKTDDVPSSLKTSGQRALYNNLDNNEDLALRIDASVNLAKRDSWKGDLIKEREVKAAIHQQLIKYSEETGTDFANEPPEPYGIQAKVEYIFNIVKEQPEY